MPGLLIFSFFELLIGSCFLPSKVTANVEQMLKGLKYSLNRARPVEYRTDAVANLLRFLSLLIKPDVRSYRIRLSD